MAEKGGGFQELERRIHEMEEQDRAEERGKDEEKEGAKRGGAARKEQGEEKK